MLSIKTFNASWVTGFWGMALFLAAAEYHPADLNQDEMLSIEEITSYAKAMVEETSWPSGPSPVKAEDVERAAFIWRNGERYVLRAGVAMEHGWVPAPLDGTVFVTITDLRPEPLDTLEVFGLPPALTGLVLEYRMEDEEARRYAPLQELGDDRWAMRVPYVPGAPGGAKPMELWVLTENERFPVVPIKPVPLPPAMGTAATVFAGLVSVSSLIGERLDGDPSLYFNAAPEAIPERLRPLVTVDRMLRDPENPNNLSRVLAGTAPLLVEMGVGVEDLDAVFGKLGMAERLDALQAVLQATPGAEPLGLAGVMRVAEASVTGLGTESALLDIASLGELAAAMKRQCEADQIANPSAEVQSIKDAASLAAIVVGLAGPVGAAAAASFSVGNWAIETYHQIIANQWPSEVDNFQLVFTPTYSPEDDCAPASWQASMNARSRDWSLDKTVVTGALNLLGAYKAGGDFLAPGAKGLRQGFANSLADAEGTMAGVLTELSGMALDKAFPDTDLIPVPAARWSGIAIADSDLGLIDVTYEGGSVVQGGSLREVVPSEVGITIVRVRTKPGALGFCAVVEGAAVIYEVRENKVTVTPSGGQVSPNQEITFTAFVTDAKNLSLEFEASHGTFYEVQSNLSTGVHIGKWRAPPVEEMPSSPITIIARSLASECLRDGVERLREVRLTPDTADYILSPEVIRCIPTGEQVVFEVLELKFGEVPPVQWELTGSGSLAPDGAQAVYTAGEPGEVTVRATVETIDGPVILEQVFTVGCGMMAGLFFQATDGPTLAGPVKTTAAVFLLEDQGAVQADVFFEYSELIPPTEENPTGVAKGVFSGAGIFFPADPEEALALIDDSEALRQYTVSTGQGTTMQYSVEAVAGLIDIDEVENTVFLPDGILGDSIEIRLDAVASSAGAVPTVEQNEIVSYNWSFSDGTLLSGAVVTKSFSRSDDELRITLEVVDKLGNWARVSETLIIVQLSGTFGFPYEPSGVLTGGFRWESDAPPPDPAETEDGYIVFITDPTACGITLDLAGGRTTSASANATGAVLVIEEDASFYGITFLTFDGIDEE